MERRIGISRLVILVTLPHLSFRHPLPLGEGRARANKKRRQKIGAQNQDATESEAKTPKTKCVFGTVESDSQ